MALPQYVKFLLFPAIGVFNLLVLTDFVQSKRWNQFTSRSFIIFLPLILHILFYFIGLVFTSYYSLTLLKDSFNLLIFTVFLFSALIYFLEKDELNKVLKGFAFLSILFSTLFALLGIIKLFYFLKGITWSFLFVNDLGYPQGTSLGVDDNFFTLVCLAGLVFVSHHLFYVKNRLQSIMLQLSLLVLMVNIMLATSRRGLIIASVYILIYLIFWLAGWVIKSESLKWFRRNSYIFLLSLVATLSLFGYLLFGVDSFKRNQWLANSSFDKKETVIYMNWLTMTCQTIFKGQLTYTDVQNRNWVTDFNSKYPYTGWASGNYHLVDNLNELGLKEVPSDAQGAEIGNWIKPIKRESSCYYYSFFLNGKIEKGKRYVASVYCYLSPDCDISSVKINTWGNLKGIRSWYYDTSKCGTWQKLFVSFEADSGSYRVGIVADNNNDTTFSNLKGSFIFAYPELYEIEKDPKRPITWANNQFIQIDSLPGGNRNIIPKGVSALKPHGKDVIYINKDSLLLYTSRLYSYSDNFVFRFNPSLFVYVSPDFDGDEVSLYAGGKIFGHTKHKYDLTRKGTWQNLYLSFNIFEGSASVNYGFRKKVKSPTDSIKGYVLFAYPEEKFLTFDSNNPITWAGSNFKSVYPLTGENIEIVPKNSVGLKVDRETQSKEMNDIAYNENLIVKIKFKNHRERVKTSVYAYASNDFNGEKVRLGGSTKNIGGNSADYYDSKRKGTWQKLTINNWGTAGDVYISKTFFTLPNAEDFSKLKGYVIFAHPEFKVLSYDPKNPESYTSSTYIREYPLIGENSGIVPTGIAGARYDRTTEGKQWKDFHHSTTEYWSLDVEAGDSVLASVYCYVSPDFNGSEARLELRGKVSGQTVSRYNLNSKGAWVLLQARGVSTEKGRVNGVYFFSQKGVTDFKNLKGYVTFAYPQLVIKHNKKTSLLDRNKLQNLASFLSLPKSHSVPDTISDDFKPLMANDRFAGPRVDRWRYAIYLYTKKYSLIQKIFGGGFDYTYRFARKFHPEDPKRDFDYPHNPFLSVLLYSGVLGLLVYIWFFVKSLYLYYIYRKEYWIFGIIYLVTFFYAFFSSNSPFEPAFFGLMGALPYLIHYSKNQTN
jgi:hypothetical protein